MIKKAFTLIEIIMVIVILGIVASIGTNIISNMYEGYIRSKSINQLQQQTELALDQIAKRLQYRIKETLIARDPTGVDKFLSLSDKNITNNYTMIEWIGYDNESLKGDYNGTMIVPGWSGFVDLNRTDTNKSQIVTLGSDLRIAENIIAKLSNGDINLTASSGKQLPAIIFKCPKLDYNLTKYGWSISGNHDYTLRVQRSGKDVLQFAEPSVANASKELCEQYWLAWSAYALVLTGTNDNYTLNLHYNYQPWYGEKYNDSTTSTTIIATNVSTFRVTQVGDSVRMKLCIQDNNITGEPFGFCKEKAIW